MSELFTAGILKAIEWAFILFVEFAGAYYGVRYGFRMDRHGKNQRFQKRVREIVPHIYIELCENSGILQMYQGYDWFYRKSIRLKTAYWEIFQSELAKWQEQNVVPLTRIYHNLTSINKNADARTEMSKIEFVTMSFETKKLIQHLLNAYEDWFVKFPEAFSEFQKTEIQYRIELESNPNLRQTLGTIRGRMKYKGLILTLCAHSMV